MIKALIFDLDDTLYLEKDFVMSGYRTVAQFLSKSDAYDVESLFSCMAETHSAEGRHRVFPVLLERFRISSITLSELVHIYRQHDPAIHLFPGYMDLLQELACSYRLGVITDGLPAIQARKVRALELERVMDKILYTWDYGADKEKPDPFSFSLMLEYFHADPESVLVVGDNPDKDCKGAHGAGIRCAQVQHPTVSRTRSGVVMQEAPEFIVDTLFQLPQILRHLN